MLHVQDTHRASSIIQEACLCYARFTKKHLLPQALFHKAQELKSLVDVTHFPRSFQGRTPVYFPPNLPIVFKHSRSPKNKERLEKMIAARNLCIASGYTYLNIPTARIHGEFLIESRLPVTRRLDQKQQIGLYIENSLLFTEAVKEFTGFLCQSKLEDISGGTNDFWARFCTAPLPRYDNVPIYLDAEKRGQICLIDLEYFSPGGGDSLTACMQAIRFFPLHLDAILQTAKTFDPDVEKHRPLLEKERGKILEYFEAVYGKHQDFLRKPSSSTFSEEDKKHLFQKLTDCIQAHAVYLQYIDSPMAMHYLQVMHRADPSQKALFSLDHLGSPKKPAIFPPDWERWKEKEAPLLLESALNLLHQTTLNSEKEWKIEIFQAQCSQENAFQSDEILASDRPFLRTILLHDESLFYKELRKIVSESLSFIEFAESHQREYLTTQCIDCLLITLYELHKIAFYASPESLVPSEQTNRFLFY